MIPNSIMIANELFTEFCPRVAPFSPPCSSTKEAASNTVDINGISPDIFEAVLRISYTDLTMENCKALLGNSHYVLDDHLKWKCESFLAQNLTIENCCELRCCPTFTTPLIWRQRPSNASAKRLLPSDEDERMEKVEESFRAGLIAKVMGSLVSAF